MDKQRARQLYELADRLSKLDVNTLSEEQLSHRNTMIAKLQEEVTTIKEMASKIISVDDKHGFITVIVQAPDGSKRAMANDNPNYIQKWLQKYGLTLPQSITSQFVGVHEEFNGEYDDEAGMVQSNLRTMARAVNGLLDTIEDNDNLPEWAQEKIAKAEMMTTSVWDYLLSQKEQGMDPKVTEAKLPEVDSLVTDTEAVMKEFQIDAEQALKTVLGNREYNSRRGYYSFYIRQIIARLNQQGVTETKKPSPRLTPVDMKKSEPVSEEINTEAYERLQKVFAFKNYES